MATGGPPSRGMWAAPFCGCIDDCETCCLGWWAPCVLYGQNKEAITGDDCATQGGIFLALCIIFPPAICCWASPTRTTLRRAYDLPEAPCNDCCVYWCCQGCALCQEARELKIRGHSAQNPVTYLRAPQQVVVVQAPPQVQPPPPPPPAAPGVPVEPKKK